jgi:CheY-like chemotaxis protein
VWTRVDDMTTSGRKILIIDDEADHAEIVGLLLRRKGYDVTIARDGREGIVRALDWKPDLVLLDLYMPAVDGFATAEHLRVDENTRRVPILFLSACGEHALRAYGPLPGHATYLAKPFRAAELLWAVEDAFGLDDELLNAPLSEAHAP